MAASVRLIQLGRIFAESPDGLTGARARDLVSSRSGHFAHALFLEAADSDDVTSAEDARIYFDARIAFFGDLVPAAAIPAIRQAYERLLARWG